ncbi:hypothetical protein L1887_40760 [Cichorium endivia]|nr:hypothetical protein L1887_40760 [Cichorium endivia]
MAESSSQTTEAISVPVLKNQSSNLVLRNDLKLYPAPIDAVVECLKRSVLGHALTYTPVVPATLVHRAHYTLNALFDANNHVKSVFYETIDAKGKTKKVQLTKEKFAEALHLPVYNSKEMMVPSADQLVTMFNEMGYEPLLEKISMCLSGRTSGLDSASVAFQGLLYGIYYDVKVDFASMLWTDFCSHINHSLKGTEIANVRFWAIVVHAHYQKSGYVPDPSLTEMRFTPIAIPALDEVPIAFCAQPEGMLSKVSNDCIEATPKKKQQKKPQKLAIRDESSESEKQTSEANPEAEEEEHKSSPIHEARPPTPPHFKIPPSPPKKTRPLTPPPPPTTAQQTPPIYTTSSEVPPISPPKTSSTPVPPITSASDTFLNIPSSDPDTSLPEFSFQEDFDFEASTFTQPPSKEETMAIFHMAPIAIEEADEEGLDDSDFILGKQYKILNRKLDALLQSKTGFDPSKKPEVSVEEKIAEAQTALIGKMEDLVHASEKKILDQQIEIKRILETKLNTAVEQVEERHRLFSGANRQDI